MPSVLLGPHPACRARGSASGNCHLAAPAPLQPLLQRRQGCQARLKSPEATLLFPLIFHSLGSRRTSEGWNSETAHRAPLPNVSAAQGAGDGEGRCAGAVPVLHSQRKPLYPKGLQRLSVRERRRLCSSGRIQAPVCLHQHRAGCEGRHSPGPQRMCYASTRVFPASWAYSGPVGWTPTSAWRVLGAFLEHVWFGFI